MFLDADFILKNSFARKLYHDYAEKQPIIDYHCHLDPQEILKPLRRRGLLEIIINGV